MGKAKKAGIASVCNATKTKPEESNSELNAEDASPIIMEGKGEEKLQEESNLQVKEEEEASDDPEEAKEENQENEKQEDEAMKMDNVEIDEKNEEEKRDESIRKLDAEEPNEKEMEMVKESREEAENSEPKKKKMIKKTIRLVKRRKIVAKRDDKGIVGVEDGELKKTVKGHEKKEEISVNDQEMEADADEAKKEVNSCKENKEAKTDVKEKQNIQNSGKRKKKSKVDGSLVSQETNRLKNKEKVASENVDKEKVATENVVMVARDAGAAGKSSSSGKKESKGLIFMCNRDTKRDCFKYKVLGLPANKKELVANVYKGMRLFLFDVDHRLMYGIYKAAAPGGYNIEPRAFNSAFPSQVRFMVVSECTPLPEEKFKVAIKDNYFGRQRFNIELTGEQVKKLCKLFRPRGNDDLARKDTGSLGIDKRQWRSVRDPRHQERARDWQPERSSRRSHRVQMGTLYRFTEIPREAEPVSRVRGLVREREQIRPHGLSRDSTLINGHYGLPRENTLVGGLHGFSRESFPMVEDHVLPRKRLLVDEVPRIEVGMYDREASDIYTREAYALPPPLPPSYAREDTLHADHLRELELERREHRLVELERRQQKMVRYEEPYQYEDPIVYHDRLLPHATDYISRRRY
ncbi:unnamed protein product [Victoria cruziana]